MFSVLCTCYCTYIPYIRVFFFSRVTKFTKMGKICNFLNLRVIFCDVKSFLQKIRSTYLLICDLKEITNKAKIRPSRKLPDVQYTVCCQPIWYNYIMQNPPQFFCYCVYYVPMSHIWLQNKETWEDKHTTLIRHLHNLDPDLTHVTKQTTIYYTYLIEKLSIKIYMFQWSLNISLSTFSCNSTF